MASHSLGFKFKLLSKESAVIKLLLGFLCFYLIICFSLHNSFVRLVLIVTLVDVDKMRLREFN